MIPLRRPPSPLDGDERIARAQARVRAQAQAQETLKFQPELWREHRDVLLAAQHGKCGYCERRFPENDGWIPIVDHYAPKSVFWWRAYCWENWVLCCGSCSKAKHDYFPERTGVSSSVESTREWCVHPRPELQPEDEYLPALLNPFDDDPRGELEGACDRSDDGLCSDGTFDPGLTERGAATIALCDLNGDGLVRTRRAVADKACSLIDCVLLEELGGPFAAESPKAQLFDLAANDREYAGFVRSLIRQELGIEHAELGALIAPDPAP